MTARPSVAIVGTGAIGCFFAAYLLEAGQADVSLCARTPFERLEVRSDTWDETVSSPVSVLTDPADAAPVDWVLLATKVHQTAGAAPWLQALCHPRTIIAVLQNGVEQIATVAPHAPSGTRILPAIVYAGVELVEPGRAVHRASGYFNLPESDEGQAVTSDEVAALAALYPTGRDFVRPTPDILTVAWEKLAGNVASNGITALTQRRMGVLREPLVRELLPSLMAEVTGVGRAEGARLADDFGPRTAEFMTQLSDALGTSMLYDRLAGRRLEEDALYGAVVRAGQRHGIPTPIHTTLLAMLSAISPKT